MNSISWFARHGVAANLLMALVLAGGILTLFNIKQEVFPEFSLDMITVTVPHLGAAPEEVEEGVCVRIEEAIQGLDGIKKIRSLAAEGFGMVTIEMEQGADSRRVLDEVKSRVDAIDTFPAETEKPVVREMTNRRQVINVAVAGQTDERSLRHLGERVRDDLSALPEVTLVELSNARPYEISIEISEEALRRHALTFDQVASAVRRSSIDLPGGSVRTSGGEILLRTKGQAYRGSEFENLVLLTRPDGTHLRLGDVAHVVDGFAITDQFSRFEDEPAVLLEVFRTGEQSALAISDAVRRYARESATTLPEGISVTVWQDSAEVLRSRLDLMVRNGRMGFVLVFITLALFLRFRLALWVSLGLILSFLGAIWFMPMLGVSVNLISLFAFILVLGIVVDDAIVVGENIHTHQHEHGDGLRGAIEGVREVTLPVVFAVLTTIAAFTPLLFVPGFMGKVMQVIPLIVIPCLIWSLVESLWILPAHLSHYRRRPGGRDGLHLWGHFQSGFARGVKRFVSGFYGPLLEKALEWRYLTISIGAAALLLSVGLIAGGFVHFHFFPDVEADFIAAAVTLPPGTPVATTSRAVQQLEEAAEKVRRELAARPDGRDMYKYKVAAIGEQPFTRIKRQNMGGVLPRDVSSHLGEVTIELISGEERNISSTDLAALWREATGPIADAISIEFTASIFSPGEDIDIQLTGPDMEELQAAAGEVRTRLATYAGIQDVGDSFRPGKRELKLKIKPSAEVLGLSLSDLGRQVRQAFYGEEAQRVQRGRDEVKVMVRYPESGRASLGHVERMRIRTPDGAEVPFTEVAEVEAGRGYAAINRVDRRRAINVTADVDLTQAAPGDIITDLQAQALPEILAGYPRVSYTLEGQQAEQRQTIGSLTGNFILALVLIYSLLAVPLRSYYQPLVIMSAIPLGLVGAVWGHVLIGLDLTIMSMFGLVALSGVVVNDSLLMVDFINRYTRVQKDLKVAIRMAGMARFRPILLTSLTTFAGLSPLMLERSMQARFLIPMAVSLAFGVLFATFITLVQIPALYLVTEDIMRFFGRQRGRVVSSPAGGGEPVTAGTPAGSGIAARTPGDTVTLRQAGIRLLPQDRFDA